MDDTNIDKQSVESPWPHLKNVFSMLTKKQFKSALIELYRFIQAVYFNYIRGHYVEISGKKIPRLALIVMGIFALYLISPMSCLFNQGISTDRTEIQTGEAYDKNGIKIYDMRKCDMAACGVLEYSGKDDIEKLRIVVVFYNAGGQAIYEGYAEALQLSPGSPRVEFKIPSEGEFAYYKLQDVQINPSDE